MPTSGESRKQEITLLLNGARNGSPEAADRLLSAVYDDLRHLARSVMSSEGPDHTLQPTAVVNEAFLRLFHPGPSESSGWHSVEIEWQSRAHFLAVAARQMRLVLIDYARQRKAAKRGGGLKIALEDAGALASASVQDFNEIDRLLNLLATKDPAAARVVELKFFGGLTDREAAHVMGVSASKLRRDWEFARSWLRQRIESRPTMNLKKEGASSR